MNKTVAERIPFSRLRAVNKDFWFSKDTTLFFHSRYPKVAYLLGDKAYFITSEQFNRHSPRLYTIRVCDMATGQVDTVGEFQQYQTEEAAKTSLLKLVE